MNYKNNIFILRNIHKSNDEELIDYTSKKILPKIYNYYKEIYNIDNCYKRYFPNLYLELLEIYNLSDLTKLIYRKNNYNKIEYIIKLLKEKNVELENYRDEAKKTLSIEDIKSYSLYINEKYLNKKRIRKICADCNKYHYGCKNLSNNFSKTMLLIIYNKKFHI